jgi:hypothetical protein
LTRAMSDQGVEVVFVLPKPFQQTANNHVRMLTPLRSAANGHINSNCDKFRTERVKHVTFFMPLILPCSLMQHRRCISSR